MAKKLNINRATKTEIMALKGVGKAKAEAINEFLERGGKFNSIEEFQSVAKLQPTYLDDIKGELQFEGKVTDFEKKPPIVIDPGNFNPREDFPPYHFPKPERYSFDVQLKGLTTESRNANPHAGYSLIVGYRIGKASKTKTFSIPSTGLVPVKIISFYKAILSDTFNLVVTSPEKSIVYDSTFQIHDEGKVEIKVPIYKSQDLEIDLKKNTGVKYDNNKLTVKAKYDKGESGIDYHTEVYDIASSNTIDVELGSNGKVVELEIEAFSSYGETYFSQTYDWAKIPASDSLKKIGINLPSPIANTIDLQLVVDSDELTNPYLDHKAVVSYDLKDPKTSNVIRKVEESYEINALGKAKISVSHYGPLGEILLQVKAPSGEVIDKRTINLTDVDANGEVEVKVPPRHLAGIEGIETLPERPKKLVGRVIDAEGTRKFEKIQVVVYASTVESPQEADYDALFVVTTESDGYFSVDMPVGYYTAAYGKVGIPKKGNIDGTSFDVPIRLEDDSVVVVDDGDAVIEIKKFFPPKVILVVEVEGDEEDSDFDKNDCNLGFNRNKMVVDEFSYYTVVRTTEPLIQGYTLEEDGDMTIQEVIDVVPISPDGDNDEADIPLNFRKKSINRNILFKHINDKKGLTFTTLKKALNESNARKLRGLIKPQKQIKAVGRHTLDIDNQIDWDEDPTIYQATTLSHGHLLHFKQEWVTDGYSLGDLLYSLPLAPGQTKQVVVFDWERREAAAKSEYLDYRDGLYNSLSRDRDVSEIVTGALSENIEGGSYAKTGSVSGGAGIGAILGPVGALLGVAGGSSKASSKAWQNSSRRTSMNDLQSLRDRTVQSANSVRSQRGTVVQSATQGERFSVETEVVANHNHSHTLTIQYFEVLRHFKIQHRLSSVQECLFIPLIMSSFDYQKILRWRETLERYVWKRKLRKGFDAIERIENDYEGSDLPTGAFADENIEYLEGSMIITFEIPSPTDLAVITEREELQDKLSRFKVFFPNITRWIDKIWEEKAERRNSVFEEYIAPEISAAIIEYLRFEAIIESGIDGTESTVSLPIDTTLTSRIKNGRNQYLSLRQFDDISGLSRKSIKSVVISKASNITLSNGQTLEDVLPANSRVIVRSANLQYRTKYSTNYLFRKNRINDDLIGYGGINDESEYVRIATPLNRTEMRNPRNEDLEIANALQDYLNDNLESFHKVLWMNMSPQRRFMFLDGIQVTDYSESEKYPLGVVRSVASVVENKVIGVVGNSLVMPVAPGFRLDPNTKGKEIDLISLYQPITPLEPVNVSIPTKGVFAEGVLGNCNSSEIIEEDRFWRWSEEPIPETPTAIGQVSTDSRRTEPLDTTQSTFPTPMINIQNAPAAPDPTGLSLASSLLKDSSFKDITGLEGNQKNAMESLKTTMSAAQAFGTKAGDMASLAAQLEAINKAKKNGLMDQATAKKQTDEAFKKYNKEKSDNLTNQLDKIKAIKEAAKKGQISDAEAKKLIDKVIAGDDNKKKSVLDNKAVADKVKEGSSLEYITEEETLKVEVTEEIEEIPSTLLKFMVNFRRPRTFTWSTGVVVNFDGHFGFDWLRDEYVNPMVKVLSDLNEDPLNKLTPLCTDPEKLKAEYLNGDPSPIRPFGTDYYPAWMSIMPYTTAEEFKHGSTMHKHGVKLSLEIDEIDALELHNNEIEFQIASPASSVLSITPAKFTLADVLEKGVKTKKVLDASKNISRTYWYLEDFVTVKCSGGVLSSDTEIQVVAKGSDREETVGKLMVYKNNIIPKAEIVMVRFTYTDKTIKLDSSYHSILKNNSYNQALIRAEVLEDELFVLDDLPDTDSDVKAFKTAYPDGTKHDSNKFMTDLVKLYSKFGANMPADSDNRTVMFITDQIAKKNTEGIAAGHAVKNVFQWGNAVVIFGTALKDETTFVHEIGHSLSLPHTFEPTTMPGVNNTHKFYMGYTDNIMDYNHKLDGTAAKNGITTTENRQFFFKWQWDVMRTDQSLKDNY